MPRHAAVLLVVVFALSLAVAAFAEEVVVPRFEITRFAVEGNTLLSEAEVATLMEPFTGKNRDFGTVQQALEALEDAYRRHGFNAVAVNLPEQELERGIVYLRVTEAKIGTVAVTGNTHFSTENIRSGLPDLKEGRVPNLDDISASLRVANENPAKKIKLELYPEEGQDRINAALKVADEKPWLAAVSLDTTGNTETGDFRVGFLLQHANLFNLDHLLTLQYITSPDHADRVRIYGAGYRIPLYSLGDSIDLFGGYSDVDFGEVTAGTGGITVSGRGIFSGIRYNLNLVRRGDYEQRLVFGADYRIYENRFTAGGTSSGTDVAVHPVSVGYIGMLTFPRGVADFNLTLLRNIPGGDMGRTSDLKAMRQDANVNYTVFRYAGSAGASLPGDAQLRVSGSGQFTRDQLVPGEQFGIGGYGTVRGFRDRELADDIGAAGSVEAFTPNFCAMLTKTDCRALAFYDLGYLSKNKPLATEPDHTFVDSFGGGIRFSMAKNVSISTDYGKVIHGAGNRRSGDGRWHLRAIFAY